VKNTTPPGGRHYLKDLNSGSRRQRLLRIGQVVLLVSFVGVAIVVIKQLGPGNYWYAVYPIAIVVLLVIVVATTSR
jgi:peptidoglycan/LPS O-acetylase OafA/YrhL